MSTAKELGNAWYGYELNHVKALLQLKEAQILKLQETIRILKRNTRFLRRQQREKRDAEAKFPKTLIYDNRPADLDMLCAKCQRYLKT